MAHGDDAVVAAVLADYRTAPIPEKLRAMLAFLEADPASGRDRTGRRGAVALAGLGDEEIADAIDVCALFNVINRVADSLGFEQADKNGYETGARMLLNNGYR